MTIRTSFAVVALMSAAELVTAQSKSRPKYMDRAIIEPHGPMATLVANDPLPLFQAISKTKPTSDAASIPTIANGAKVAARYTL